ncbi:MAG: hypothetical protein E7326_07745 [Clostridiales bacterium]|nr:hypothetical protein [Clostridiales bacterium]
MSKWKHVPEKRRQEIFAFNKSRAADREAAQDLHALLSALPVGQQKQLMKDAACAAILRKYGIEE